jgi:hypothetical protein
MKVSLSGGILALCVALLHLTTAAPIPRHLLKPKDQNVAPVEEVEGGN